MAAKVRRNADGVWECRLYLGRSATGRPIRPYRSFPDAGSEEEAQRQADEWAASLSLDGNVHSTRLTDLLEEYVEAMGRNGASPNTTRAYGLFTRYADRYLRNANVRELGVTDLNRFMQRLLTAKDEGGQGLSRNSVNGVYEFLRGAYYYFMQIGACDHNVMLSVSHPKVERHEASAISEWDYAELSARLTEALERDVEGEADYRSMVCAFGAWLALVTGMRRGEVCAVRRRDVNRAQSYVHVSGNVIEERGKAPWRRELTKGKRSRNVTVTAGDMATIVRYVRRQDAFLGRQPATAPLVTLDGGYMRPSKLAAAFAATRRECGLPEGVTFHSLRHTHASWLVANGCDLKTLSERLGHADEATTLRIYAHLIPGRDSAAASLFEEVRRRAGDAGGAVPADCQRDAGGATLEAPEGAGSGPRAGQPGALHGR